MNIYDTVRQVVAQELCIPDWEVRADRTFVDMGADSMDLRALMLDFEEELGIEIPDDDATNLYTPGDVIKYVASREKN